MKNWYDETPTFTELGESIVVGRPAFVASFYSYSGFMPHALAAFDAWLGLLPPKTELWYSHEETKRFLKLTPSAITKIRTELSVPSITKRFKHYFVKSVGASGNVDECHAYSFEIFATPGKSGFVYVTFPRDHVESAGADAVVRWFGQWCSQFEFTHAAAGFGYEVAWFGEQAECAGPTILATALRFHGVRAWEPNHARFREWNKTTLDTVGWLTYLDAESMEEVGLDALERIDARVARHPVGKGLVLQAGPEPDPCDTNRRGDAYALLKSVNDAIVPIRATKWWIGGWGARGEPEKESGWFSRMDK